jgi:CubicO group peptidase (beta-lactamase class C family)
MNMPKIIFIFFLLTSATVWGQEWSWADKASSGFRSTAKLHYVAPADQIKTLNVNDSAIQPDVKKTIDGQIKRLPTRALIVAKGDQIFYEYYSSRSSRRWTPFGFSMSKSLTAMTVGKALCDGSIASIDDPLEKYVSELSGTSWGVASIKSVLMMSSGAYKTNRWLHGHKTKEVGDRLGEPVLLGQMRENYIAVMKEIDEKEFNPGQVFNYNNMDTLALGLLVESATGKKFSDYFEESIWKPSGAQARGAWAVNNLGQTSTYQSFSASPHDWLRIGLYVLEQRSQEHCFSEFLVQGTTGLLATNSRGFGPNSYGFQIWVNCRPEVNFCFEGLGRQYLWFNLRKNVVMYHHAATDTLDEGALLSAFMNVLASID